MVAVLALVSCSSETERAAGRDEPMAEHLEQAAEIAAQEWDAPWILQSASSRYDLDEGGDPVLNDHAYLFVSDNGAASYSLVRFHADGSVSSLPVAGRAAFDPEAFELGTNTVVSVEALEIAWTEIGESLLGRCGPVRWVDVTGVRDEEGQQWWRVEHSTVGDVHTVWVDAASGAVGEVVEEPC